MEGPTPVSALIHAATMVTAGVYMVARSNALFVLAPNAMKTVAIVGALTAIFAATIGLVQNDIKRVLAYSTVSQLGYMFLALGVGAFAAGVFHVFTHAFFKALLFLGSGSVIHAMSGEQDMQHMGALRRKIKTTFGTMLIGDAGDRRHSGFRGLLLEGRHPVGDMVARRRRLSLLVVHRFPHRADDVVLHVPADLPDVLRQAAHEPRGRAPHPRVAQDDDGAAGDPGDLLAWARAVSGCRTVLADRTASRSFWSRCSRRKPLCWRKAARPPRSPPARQQVEHTDPLEYALMFASVGAAVAGWWLAQRAYKKADKGYKEPIQEISPRFYKTLFRK